MIKEEEEYTTSEEYVLTAVEYINNKNYTEAKKYLLKAHELFPDNIWPLSYLLFIEQKKNFGLKNFEPKNFEEEIRLRYKIIELTENQQLFTGYLDNDVFIYLMLGDVLIRAERYEEAIEISKRALDFIGEDLKLKGSLYTRLCNEYFKIGDYKESLMYANKSLEIYPGLQDIKKIKKSILERKDSK
jgi:tetratricopeptide (TPR) repeat protein